MNLKFSALIIFLALMTNAQSQRTAEDWFNEGFIQDLQGNYTEAIQAYDEAIKLKPDYAEAWNNKGFAFFKMGKYNESLQAANRSLELEPIAENWDTKGAALYGLGKYEEALECYNKAIELNSEIGEVWYHKAEALKALGRDAEAEAAYARVEKMELNFNSRPENLTPELMENQEETTNKSWWQFWK